MKRYCVMILVFSMLFSLLAGCGETPAATEDSLAAPQSEQTETAVQTTEAVQTTAAPSTVAPTSAPQPPSDPNLPAISWSDAFRDQNVPEGTVSADCVAFLQKSSDGSMRVCNVLRKDILSGQSDCLPRTHFFEQYMPQELVEELLPVMDYAVMNGYSRFCIPATAVSYKMVKQSSRYLSYDYDINNQSPIDVFPVKSIPQEEGELNFLLITLCGMEKGNTVELYRKGIEVAREIVDAVPDDYDEGQKMIYLYRYLTDNVRYFNGDYYGTDYCFLYDALVRHSTVCAGYAEALYVLCNMAGIECMVVTGEVGALSDANDLHAWNVARVNGQYYQFDTTWDEGKSPADFWYCGMSTEFAMAHHTRLLGAFETDFCPDCPESLLPESIFPEKLEKETDMISTYYLLCNTRDYNPRKIFEFLGYSDDDIQYGEPKDGWVTATFSMKQFQAIMQYLMTEQQMELFMSGSFRQDIIGELMYRVPDGNQPLARLTGLEKNADGSWKATVLEMAPDGSYTTRKDRVTIEPYGNDWWRVAAVETNVE